MFEDLQIMKGTFIQIPGFYLVFLLYFFLIPIKANGTPPIPPQLVSPPNSSDDIPLTPRLEWAPSLGAISYQVEIRAVLDKVEYPIFLNETEDTYFDIPPGYLAVSVHYIWGVRTIEEVDYGVENNGGEKTYSKWSNRSFATGLISAITGNCEDDDDCDGIPNSLEIKILKTNPHKKTLFVRPKKEIDDELYAYWEEFYTKLFPGSSNGRMNIPAFVLAGIEVVVIGEMDNPYIPMKDFQYDPANDGKKPPCDILEITLKERQAWKDGRCTVALLMMPITRAIPILCRMIATIDLSGHGAPSVMHHPQKSHTNTLRLLFILMRSIIILKRAHMKR